MGYGLVDIPRYLLRKADRHGWLKHYMIQVHFLSIEVYTLTHGQAAVYKKEMEITKEKLDDTLMVGWLVFLWRHTYFLFRKLE